MVAYYGLVLGFYKGWDTVWEAATEGTEAGFALEGWLAGTSGSSTIIESISQSIISWICLTF